MTRIYDLDTPALLIDLDVMERNLARAASYAREHNLRLRPHTKTHKIPALARRQLALGAAGLTTAKTTEAEVMLQAEPPELLIAYPVVGAAKLERLAHLASRTSVTVALDSLFAAETISSAMSSQGARVGVLVEWDAGLHRVGVGSHAELLNLTQRISRLPGVDFRGLAFYPGHIKVRGEEYGSQLEELNRSLTEAVQAIEKAGSQVDIVSGGSTPTLFESHRLDRMNEIRPGTYIFNDRNTWLTGACSLDDCAVSILTTVVSTSVSGQAIVDGGSKTFSSDRSALPDGTGFGYFPDAPEAVLVRMNEEHGFVDIAKTERNWCPGQTVRIVPNHVCVAMNLHETVYGVRGEDVVEVWNVEGRGKLQ